MHIISHKPYTGSHITLHRGKSVTFALELDAPAGGRAWLRTNIGNAALHRQEIIQQVENHEPVLDRDWTDITMQQDSTNPARFTITLPLAEVGRFEAKAFFMPDNASQPVWPDGNNTIIKVEPAHTLAGNSIYTAFIRQFGPHYQLSKITPRPDEMLATLENDGYSVIPQSGTFRQFSKHLDLIINQMGFGIIQLLPIHPVPTTYARMGRFGSPFAAIDFFDVDPALAEFDRKTTPLDQFGELTDAIHARESRIFIDLPINHTGWASHLQLHHPEWFARSSDSSFKSPGAWGITWEDLSELDYTHKKLWQYMADVFLFWCRRGVDGFRCDAGYMVPLPVWEYIIAKVRSEFPDTIFMLEGLGGKISVTQNLLDQANMNWAYSEIFQVYDRAQLEHYLPGAFNISKHYGTLVNFAETHDNNRLAAESPNYARMRTALAALASEAGAFGITNGVEWFATAKVDVHGASPLNWGAAENQVESITRLNRLLKTHPAFSAGTELRLIQTGEGNAIALLRRPENSADTLLALINLDCNSGATIAWPSAEFMPEKSEATDLLSGTAISIKPGPNGLALAELPPASTICLALKPNPAQQLTDLSAAAAAMKFMRRHSSITNIESLNSPQQIAARLCQSPEAFCSETTRRPLAASITSWTWPRDLNRTVMLPCGHDLLLKAPHPFRARLCNNKLTLSAADSICAADGTWFTLLAAPSETESPQQLTLKTAITIPDNKTQPKSKPKIQHNTSPLISLSNGRSATITTTLNRIDVDGSQRCALLTNNRGAISQVRLEWSNIESQYDCILGANLHNAVPVDRQILFTRCRAWIVHRDYSHPISTDYLDRVSVSPKKIIWIFNSPVGMGKSVKTAITLKMTPDHNQTTITFQRLACDDANNDLNPAEPVTLILRPDIEDRNFHETTKAYTGPEHNFPAAVNPQPSGFSFSPYGNHTLEVELREGRFISEPEWSYGVGHPFEAQRGLDSSGDLFSPGYFKTQLTCNQTASLDIQAVMAGEKKVPAVIDSAPLTKEPSNIEPQSQPYAEAMRKAIKAYIVKRDDTRTVIAGYPWFLDWGRDTLICLRGIIAAGLLNEARDILIQFARFEKQGTLPNMIRGNDDSNRDTTDAPLWFFTACADFINASEQDFINTDCDGRSIRQILTSIANGYINGTPNGIHMDHESGLIFSPSHFTWMDTNFPAGTPREGYPIEIQALWFAALRLMQQIDTSPKWTELANQVQHSIEELYTIPDHPWLADCLLASSGIPAKQAIPDNALRPNQLFAITLGAISNRTRATEILAATEELLIPGAIRSLADRPVAPPLPIERDGVMLNDPHNPYWGYYGDDEDTRRKPAYHNGTAWTWQFPSYCEALLKIGGEDLRPTALSILSSGALLANKGCVGHLPEILDGNTPHAQRGCPAQAWGDTETFRVLKLLSQSTPENHAT